MIQRLFPRSFDQTPFDIFSLLLIGQGFPDAQTSYNVCNAAWDSVRKVAPLNLFADGRDGAWAIAVHHEDSVGLDLGLTQAGGQLALPAAAQQKLDAYLAATTISDDEGRTYPAQDVWGDYGRAGEVGAVIAIVVAPDTTSPTPAEYYQPIVGQGYRRPVVAVVATGDWWHMILARAVAQVYATLADEYELPGRAFAAVPDGTWVPPANVIYVAPDKRARIAAGENPVSVIGWDNFPRLWHVNVATQLSYYAHQGDVVNPAPAQPPNGREQLVEGATYRTGAYRCDFDCVMRRQPNNPSLPIQAHVEFCRVCRTALETALKGHPGFEFGGRRVRLNTQRVHYDKVTWSSVTRVDPLPAAPFTVTAASPKGAPVWDFVATVEGSDGLRISNLKLKSRPGDPYKAAEDVCESITFENLWVSLDGGAPTPLAVADAFANKKQPPRLERATTGGLSNEYLAGLKLVLTWAHASGWQLEAAMSIVVRDKRNDFDPGGAAEACKFYPQLALRYVMPRLLRGASAKKLPKVTGLGGNVVLHTNNVIPTSLKPTLDSTLADMANGMLAASLFVDSNASDTDSRYKFDSFPITDPVATLMGIFGITPDPPYGLWGGEWQQGRKLAGVVDPTAPTPALAGATARWLHLFASFPGLPHWSWLFDYCWPDFDGKKQFVGVYRAGETTAGGKQNQHRSAYVDWPPAADQAGTAKPYRMTVTKLPRQGAYDSVHVNAAMMNDSQGRDVVAAPFCADLCLHLHWRWGTVALTGAIPHQLNILRGWGDGVGDEGAGSKPGYVLIPPNQHLDVTVEKPAMDRAQITYAVSVDRPRHREWQVLLEQGLGFAFTYNGLDLPTVGLLGSGLGALSFSPLHTYSGWVKDMAAATPAERDRRLRLLFLDIYSRIRWYDPDLDGTKTATVQQIPGWHAPAGDTPPPAHDGGGKAVDLEAF